MNVGRYFILVYIILFYALNALACSVFMYSDNNRILFGNNEDSPIGEEAVLTFVPARRKQLGYFFISLQNIPNPLVADYPQGGMNEKGLAYDITATPLMKPVELIIPENTPYPEGNLMIKVLSEASNVDEAVNIIFKYKASEKIRKQTGLSEFRQMQAFIADAQGNAVIIGIGKDGDLVVTRKEKNYHLVTNFSVVQMENSLVQERLRYDIANKMLSQIENPTVDKFKTILSAIHVEGIAATLYSTIYDLQSLDIYIYNFHDYQFQKKLNLRDELLKREHSIALSNLFKDHPLFSITSMKELVQSMNSLNSELQSTRDQLDTCKSRLNACENP